MWSGHWLELMVCNYVETWYRIQVSDIKIYNNSWEILHFLKEKSFKCEKVSTYLMLTRWKNIYVIGSACRIENNFEITFKEKKQTNSLQLILGSRRVSFRCGMWSRQNSIFIRFSKEYITLHSGKRSIENSSLNRQLKTCRY